MQTTKKRQRCNKCNIGCFESISCPKCGGDLVTVTVTEAVTASGKGTEIMESESQVIPLTHTEVKEALKQHYIALGMVESDATRLVGLGTEEVTDADLLDLKL